LPLTAFCQVQDALYVQVLRSPILSALLHGTPAAGVSQSWRRYTRNGITELSQMAPPIFGCSAMTLASAHILVLSDIRCFVLMTDVVRNVNKVVTQITPPLDAVWMQSISVL